MNDLNKTLDVLISKFQSQRTITHNLWALYTVTTFTAAAFSFQNSAELRLSIFVVIGFIAFTVGHMALIRQSIIATNGIAKSINEISDADDSHLSKAGKIIASTANPIWISTAIHLTIDFCVCVLIIFAGQRA